VEEGISLKMKDTNKIKSEILLCQVRTVHFNKI
jgi:hypothetical protein